MPEAQALSVEELGPVLATLELDPESTAVLGALLPEIRERLEDLIALGLGHLSLDRRSRTLSEGELQRVRLAGLLRSVTKWAVSRK